MTNAEYRSKILTRLAGGNPKWGCYLLAVSIFSLGILRDHLSVLAGLFTYTILTSLLLPTQIGTRRPRVHLLTPYLRPLRS